MTLGISVTAVGTTDVTLGFANRVAGSTLELQHSLRDDFQFGPAPIYSIADAAAATIGALNQRGRYFLRGRIRKADGTLEGGWSPTVDFRTGAGAAQNVVPTGIVVAPATIVKPSAILQWSQSPVASPAGYPPANLTRDEPTSMHVLSNGTGVYTLYFQTSEAIDTIALLNTNLPEDCTIEFRCGTSTAGADAGTGGFIYGPVAFRASANVPARPGYHGIFTLPWGDPGPTRSWYRVRITLGAQKLPGDLLYIEHLIAGLNRATKNMAVDSAESPINLGQVQRNRAGLLDEQRGYKLRRYELDIAQLPETQRETLLREVWMWLDEPMLIVPNSKANGFLHDRILYGRLSTGKTSKPSALRYNVSLGIDSIV